MVRFWYKRIRGDIDRIGEVPALWREAVREMIAESGTSDE